MSQISKKRLKQATLSFVNVSPSKKRKRDDDINVEEDQKSLKTCDTKPKIDLNIIEKLKNNDIDKTTIDDVTNTNNKCPSITTEEKQSSKIEEINNEKMDIDIQIEETCLLDTDKTISPAKVPILAENLNENKVSLLNVTNLPEDQEVNSDEAEQNIDVKAGDSQIKKLTPKQLQKKQESEAKKLEREKLKQEREKKRLEEKKMKEQKRLAEIEAKNEEKRQKEEEKRQKEEEKRKQKESERKAKEEERKAKEEERKAKEEERKAKEEERKAKEEERKAKEEERLKKLEEKRLKEEQEKKNKEKIAADFKNFFLSKNKTSQSKTTTENGNVTVNSLFMPFEVKKDMKLAVISRTTLTPERKQYLDTMLKENIFLDKSDLYLSQIKSKNYKPRHSENTWPLNLNDDEDLKTDNSLNHEVRTRYRCKLLQFSENRRPPYWGTWRKRSKVISGKTPFKSDNEFFEYDVDSDEEWVEEPGESLHGSDDEKESDHEYEVDNDFFVPHGYLSDEEAPQDDETEDKSSKSQSMKLDILKTEFEAELKEKTCKLKSRFYGCTWISNHVQKNEGANDIENLLLLFRGVWNDELTPFCWKHNTEENNSRNSSTQNTPSVKTKAHYKFPEQYLPDFIQLVHANKNSAKNLTTEFIAYILAKDPELNLARTCVKKKLKEIAIWQQHTCFWYVHDEIRHKYDLGELSSSENAWKYVSSVCFQVLPRKNQKQTNTTEKQQPTTIGNCSPQTTQTITQSTPKHSSIMKFVKVLTPEEKERQLKIAASEKKTESTPPKIQFVETNADDKPVKKRAVLFSLKKDGNWTQIENSGSIPPSPSASVKTGNVSINSISASASTNSHVTISNPIIKAIIESNAQAENATEINISVVGEKNKSSSVVNEEVENKPPIEMKVTEVCAAVNADNEAEKILTNKSFTEETTASNNVVIKQGRKYATLIPIRKTKE